MSAPTVKSISISEAKKEVKKCNKIVRDYVRSLEHIIEMNKHLQLEMMAKIRNNEKNRKWIGGKP